MHDSFKAVQNAIEIRLWMDSEKAVTSDCVKALWISRKVSTVQRLTENMLFLSISVSDGGVFVSREMMGIQ